MQEEEWACDACFSKNPTSADFCQVCYYPQPRQSSPVNVPQESIPSIPVRQYTQDSVEGYHTPPRGGSPSTYGTPDQKREHDGEIYAPYSPEDHNKGDRKRDGELVSRHSMTPSSLPTTVVNRDRDRLSTRPVTFDLVEFVYAIGVKPFYQGQDSVAEKNARKLVDLLQMKLGQKYVQLVIAVSDEGSPGAFIKVGASFQDLEKLAEEQKLELKVKDEYAERTGQHYQAFTRKLKAANVFHHPCLYTSPKADFNYDCSRGNPGRPCTCDLFLPFHKEELVKHVIHECLDTFMGEKFEGFGLRTAVAKGVVQEVFPLHMDKRYRDDFAKNYVMWRSVLRTPWAFTDRSRRFIEYWRAYFGEKMGMYMGFLHYYITALLFLAIPGIVLTVFSYLEGADNFGVPMYCMYVGVWSIIWLQMWARKQSVWAYGWGMENFESEEKEIPDYIRRTADQRLAFGFYSGGDWIDLDAYARAKLQEEQAGHISADMSITQLIPKNKSRTDGSIRRTSKQIFTNSVLLTFSAGVVFATLGLLLFRLIVQRANDYWGGFAGGVLNGVSIFILEQVYMRIAMALNDWENHRTATEYEDSLVYKTFFFGFVNAYCSLFYIAFYKGHSSLFGYEDYCKDARGARSPDCMTELSTQLYSILLTRLFLGTVIEVSVPWITLRWNMYRSQRRITAMKARGGESLLPSRQRLKDAVQTEADMPSYSTAKVSGTFYDYYELAVQFGFVVLFAPAFPLAPFLALMSNIVEVATDGYKTLEEMKKPVYHGAADIGPWYNVFNFLCVIGVITNSLIIGFTSNQLDYWLEYPSASNKWLFVVFIEHVVLAFLYLIAMGIPNQPKWVREKVAKASKISDIETEYVSAVKVWRSEKDSHLNAAMLSKYQYDASEDEKETSAERSAPAPTGVSGGGGYSRGYGLGSWDEPGAPSGAPSYHYGAPTGSSNHGIIPGLDASQSTARSYLNYGGPSYGTQQFSQTEQRGY